MSITAKALRVLAGEFSAKVERNLDGQITGKTERISAGSIELPFAVDVYYIDWFGGLMPHNYFAPGWT